RDRRARTADCTANCTVAIAKPCELGVLLPPSRRADGPQARSEAERRRKGTATALPCRVLVHNPTLHKAGLSGWQTVGDESGPETLAVSNLSNLLEKEINSGR